MSEERDAMRECWSCENKRSVPGNTHIRCDDPDSEMTGDTHGIKSGWFNYPLLFDPVWKTKLCRHYKEKVEEDER